MGILIKKKNFGKCLKCTERGRNKSKMSLPLGVGLFFFFSIIGENYTNWGRKRNATHPSRPNSNATTYVEHFPETVSSKGSYSSLSRRPRCSAAPSWLPSLPAHLPSCVGSPGELGPCPRNLRICHTALHVVGPQKLLLN